MSVFIIDAKAKEKMSEEERTKFEELEENYMSKRGVNSSILGLILPQWWIDIENSNDEVTDLLRDDISASGDVDLTPLFIKKLYDVEVSDEEDIEQKKIYNRHKRVFFSERRLAMCLNYIEKMESKYLPKKTKHSENDWKDLHSNKVKGE